jgi:hypothetical protein
MPTVIPRLIPMAVYQATSRTTTSFNAGSLFAIARTACERSAENNQDAVVAIVFAALAIEAFLADMIEMAEVQIYMGSTSQPLKNFANLLDELERSHGQLALKVQIAALSLSSETFDKGRPPFQDFSLLIALRNQLVHIKPDVVEHSPESWVRPERRVSDLLQGLRQRSLISKNLDDSRVTWTVLVSTPNVANWAYSTARQMAQEIVDKIPEPNFKSQMKIALQLIDGEMPEGFTKVE